MSDDRLSGLVQARDAVVNHPEAWTIIDRLVVHRANLVEGRQPPRESWVSLPCCGADPSHGHRIDCLEKPRHRGDSW